MYYFYKVRLRYWKNREFFYKDYIVSFCEIIDFLLEKKIKNSSMEIYYIKPYFHNKLYSKKPM